ncbi:multidrug efflux MFS transporter MdtM [Entomohabitans teleogrylli]|uniref:multidrug efflux MFS transporter MdtM n=1 Tax=Entomohabitans teleogrylli TaxID=1384589 RepID=UPI00073D325F|nr:multidrug efflux MFS transporter MdtM [Entomohabitans teleogrylli]
MHRISSPLSLLLFPVALILYEFAAYLTTDMIQPGIIHVVREFNADVSLAPASISMYMAGGMALQWLLGPLSDRVGRRPVLLSGALIFTLACLATLFTTTMEQYLLARIVQGTSICFIATVGYVTIQEAFGETKGIKLMAIITSVVLIAPIIGPLVGATLIHFMHWKSLFGIIAGMGFIAWLGLLLCMPETIKQKSVSFNVISVLQDFRQVFRNRIFIAGVATISFSYVPMMTWVAVSPVILIDDGGMSSGQFAWTQVPVFGAVILANMMIAKFIKDPTSPRFIWRCVPIQITGLALLIAGNQLYPHVWIWSVAGTSIYAFGVGAVFPTLFRFTLFSNDLPKGTVSASLNIVVLSACAGSVEIARWLYLEAGGRLSFHMLALGCGILTVICLARLLTLMATKTAPAEVSAS